MHIPENYLSPETCAVMSVVMLPVWYLAVKKVKEEMPKDKLPLLGIGAAFCFLGMMFNPKVPKIISRMEYQHPLLNTKQPVSLSFRIDGYRVLSVDTVRLYPVHPIRFAS